MARKLLTLAALGMLTGASAASAQTNDVNGLIGRRGPVTQTSAEGSLQSAHGKCFDYAVPAGSRVAEEGQFAVVLVAPDSQALTVMTGNCGLPKNSNPGQFVANKLAMFRYPDLRMSDQPRQVQAINGFAAAWQFDYAYSANGVPCRRRRDMPCAARV